MQPEQILHQEYRLKNMAADVERSELRNSMEHTARLRVYLFCGILIILCLSLMHALPCNGAEEAEAEKVLSREEREEEPSSSRTGAGRRQRHGSQVVENPRLNNFISRHFDSVFAECETSLRIYQADDFLLIRAGRLMGAAEIGLLESGGEGDPGLIREMKTRLLESTIQRLMSGVSEETGLKLGESYISYSPADDEMVVILNIDTAKEAV
jgi:hypothetical protein